MAKTAHNRIDIPEETLRSMYIDSGMSCLAISAILGVSDGCVKSNLTRYAIPTRTISQATALFHERHTPLTEDAKRFIDGELLGDGCLTVYHNGRPDRPARFEYGSKHLMYIEWLSSQLDSYGIQQAGSIGRRVRNGVLDFKYASLTSVDLGELRRRWYPDGVKIVPQDIVLSPLTVRQWYIGDGSLDKTGGRIILATHCFSSQDKTRLARLLADQIGNTVVADCDVIRIGTKSFREFFDYIGGCPIDVDDVYGYKWDWLSTSASWYKGGLRTHCRRGHPRVIADDCPVTGNLKCKECRRAREKKRVRCRRKANQDDA